LCKGGGTYRSASKRKRMRPQEELSRHAPQEGSPSLELYSKGTCLQTGTGRRGVASKESRGGVKRRDLQGRPGKRRGRKESAYAGKKGGTDGTGGHPSGEVRKDTRYRLRGSRGGNATSDFDSEERGTLRRRRGLSLQGSEGTDHASWRTAFKERNLHTYHRSRRSRELSRKNPLLSKKRKLISHAEGKGGFNL